MAAKFLDLLAAGLDLLTADLDLLVTDLDLLSLFFLVTAASYFFFFFLVASLAAGFERWLTVLIAYGLTPGGQRLICSSLATTSCS